VTRLRSLRTGVVASTVLVGSLAWTAPIRHLHVALRASEPAANDTLATPPRAIRLEFTQAIEVPLSRVTLTGRDSIELSLSPARAADSTDRAIVADVASAMQAGSYRVRWTVTSRDSHTIRGEYAFTVLRAAADTSLAATRAIDADSSAASTTGEQTAGDSAEFDAQSPAYVLVRWLTYAGMLGVIGALLFRVAVLRTAQRRHSMDDPATAMAFRTALSGARVGGIVAAVVLLIAAVLRLAAQLRTVVGEMTFDPAMTRALLTDTEWGWGWIAQVVAALTALGIAARRDDLTSNVSIAPVEIVGGLAAVALAVSAALSGHPAAATPAWLAVGLDAGHVLAAGGWIGTLAYVALAGVPATSCMQPDCRPPVVRDLITSFSNVAVVCVAAIVLTGLAAAWIQMQSVPALWTTPYGRVLLIKLGLFALVGAVGAYNWRVTTPRVLATGGISRLRAAIAFELGFAVLLLGATAVLVATPPPAEAMGVPASAVAP